MSLIFNLSYGTNSLVKKYTFKDIKVDINTTNDNLDIGTSIDINAVQNSIQNIFLFSQGERILNPAFGNSLYKYLYSPINDITSQKIGAEVINLITRWEPRISIIEVIVEPFPDEHTYNIQVIYSIPRLNTGTLNFEMAVTQR